jgi:hypothetical protein
MLRGFATFRAKAHGFPEGGLNEATPTGEAQPRALLKRTTLR